jgi:N12 class adenine-specific DNA methylase
MRISGPIGTAIIFLSHLLAKTNTSIVTFGHDVRQAVVNDDFHLDVGVIRQELRQGNPEDCFGCMLACCNPDRASGLLA